MLENLYYRLRSQNSRVLAVFVEGKRSDAEMTGNTLVARVNLARTTEGAGTATLMAAVLGIDWIHRVRIHYEARTRG